MKNIIFVSVLCMGIGAFAAVPTISNVSIAQASDVRSVMITYDLDSEAIVTLELQTNGIALPPEAHWPVAGTVNRRVPAGTGHTVVWRPDRLAEPVDISSVKPVLTAWNVDVPPQYMVVPLALSGTAPSYYASAGMVPHGVTNRMYKTTHLVLAKIPAAGRTWMVGAVSGEQGTAEREVQRLVTFTNDYYMGIYEFTGGQWMQFMSSNPSASHNYSDKDVCPVENCSYATIRGSNFIPTAALGAGTLISNIQARTGMAIDLPHHAQWEVAARAGCTGAVNVPGATINQVAWTTGNPASDPKRASGYYTGNCTHEVGLLLPNAFGLYDTQGNVLEIGRGNLYAANAEQNLASHGLTAETAKFIVEVEPQLNAQSMTLNGSTVNATYKVGRWGGGWSSANNSNQSISRWAFTDASAYNDTGFRVMCPVVNGGRLAQ